MLSSGVHESSELSNLAWDLRTLHDDFNKQLSARGSSLKDAVSFFMNAEQVRERYVNNFQFDSLGASFGNSGQLAWITLKIELRYYLNCSYLRRSTVAAALLC